MIVVIGAGAAGLAAGIFARAAGRPVTILERTADGGRKILISGGGRCNVLPAALEPARFVSESSPRVVQRLLRSWPLEAQLEFFRHDVGVPLAFEAESRKWFPASNRARDVRDGLVALARRAGAVVQFDTAVSGIERSAPAWRIATSRGVVDAEAIVIATGGLSVPMTGSTGTGLEIAAALGHKVHGPYPALTPLLSAGAPYATLAGVSLNVRIRAEAGEAIRADARGGFLFTHRGYSGPSVLDVSHVVARVSASRAPARVHVQWSDRDAAAWGRALIDAPGRVVNVPARVLPARLAERLVLDAGIPLSRRTSELRRDERAALVERLVNFDLPVTGDEGYRKAEVTGGGVALDEVDPRTLESVRHRGLYFCGEVLDAFGPIGGHNFAWAWATGRLAGRGAGGITMR
jgi:predicted Rossmann fold flavoprotein